MPLSNAAVKAARPRSRAYKMFDERGLFLFVTPGGLRSWRLKYRIDGREKLLCLGQWPDVQLIDARDRAEEARGLIGQGVDPSGTNRAARQIRTFESVAREWHALQLERWTDRHAADVLDSLARDVFSEIGTLPIGAIGAPAVLQVLRDVERRGSIETARRIRQRISAVFSFAIAEGLVENDPAAIVGKALRAPAPTRRQPALLSIEDARGLLDAAERAGGPPIVRLASLFLALTAVRMGALLGATWDEFEGLDGDTPLWRVPAARMKLARAKKGDRANDHLVPLSAAAVAVLKAVKENGYDTHSSLVFPIRPAAIGALYARAGYAGRHVPHGWRATFSTILNELFRSDRAAIDMALAHTPKGESESEGAYNRAQLLDRRRELFQRWGELLIT
ncbi:integrase [Sphingobium indicum IP26]|uniref:Integrase n=1 Tax=Sphingobium indicum F2 TaxID=1450518 RepID=A0A8E1C375_9SPHN|nr:MULTISPECIES: integrase arm-type DNA-binding domain-containing protein [Sphingobium]EPR09629.1 integrase [Sphingobium indicum IP26]EQB04848.1 integrase [Sphingobium sp. HDIP04]KER36653.1 integrase [Sphingobium indicum F2]